MGSTISAYKKGMYTGDGVRFGEGSEGGGGKFLSLSTLFGDNFSRSLLALRSSRSFALRFFSSW